MSNESNKDQEQEVKFLLSDLPGLQSRLENYGAPLVQLRVHEFNLRFDTNDGALTQASRVLRLRQDSEAYLTYKGPSNLESGVTVREEIEFRVDDFAAARRLFEALGYQLVLIYEKYRAVYEMDIAGKPNAGGSSDQGEPPRLLVTLDQMPFGDFAEIEGPDRQSIQACAERLGLDWQARILHSYTVMFSELKDRRALKFRDLTFANFEALEVFPEDLGAAPADARS